MGPALRIILVSASENPKRNLRLKLGPQAIQSGSSNYKDHIGCSWFLCIAYVKLIQNSSTIVSSISDFFDKGQGSTSNRSVSHTAQTPAKYQEPSPPGGIRGGGDGEGPKHVGISEGSWGSWGVKMDFQRVP